MSLINVGQYLLGALFPYGPFNRICEDLPGIYLESGMLKFKSGYFIPESYKPAEWQYNTNYSKIVGNIQFESVLMEDVLIGYYPARVYKVKKVIYSTRNSDIRILESIALGCSVKTDSVEMKNPQGDEAQCSYTYISSFTPPLVPNPSSLGSLMSYVDAKATASLSTRSGESGIKTSCIKPDHTTESFSDPGNKVYCSPAIIDKKFCHRLFPASVFSGKLRLYVQCIYGSNVIKYLTDQSDTPLRSLWVGMYPEVEDPDRCPRIAALGRGTHWLYTHNYHHFLIRCSDFAIRPLVPIEQGHRFKRWLQSSPQGYSTEELANLEAYLLTVSFPTTGITTTASLQAAQEAWKYGAPFDYGFNANWDGSAAIMVAQTRDDNFNRITTTVRVAVSVSDLETILNDDMGRKCEALKLDFMVKNGTAVYPYGVYRRYVSKAEWKRIPDPQPGDPNHTKDIVYGDIDDGEWWYFTHIAPGDEQNEQLKQQLQEQMEDSNRVYGGLPYTQECLEALANDFAFEVSAEPTIPWQEPVQTDKIFTWDPYVRDYKYEYPCNPRNFAEPCNGTPEGEYPVYAWYNRTGQEVIIKFKYRNMVTGEGEGYPPEGMCGPGYDKEYSKVYSNGSESGFMVNEFRVIKKTSGHFTRHFADVIISAGRWLSGPAKRIWIAGCGADFCDGTEIPPGGGIERFFTHWVSGRYGEGRHKDDNSTGSTGHYSFLLIPKDDCQAVHTGVLQQETETVTTVEKLYDNCVNAIRIAGITWAGTPRVVPYDAMGWITCTGFYFSRIYRADRSDPTPDQFATSNWCLVLPTDPDLAQCNFRKWGPDGPEYVNAGLCTPELNGLKSTVTKSFIRVRKSISCYYVDPTGLKTTVVNGEAVGESTSTAEGAIAEATAKCVLTNPYPYLLKFINLRWPYADCGPIYNSSSTTNKEGKLSQIIADGPGPVTWPRYKPLAWPFAADFIHPVGYV